MRVPCKKVLKRFRGPGPCEWCHRWVQVRHAAHVFGKGQGGGFLMNVPINLASLCFGCHIEGHHAGKRPTRDDLIALVARREQLSVAELTRELHRLRRLDKEGHEPRRVTP